MSEAAHMSWWPRPGHFDAGGLNVDFWTRDCEKWFQHRALECAARPNIMTATRWRKAMHMQHLLRRTPVKNQALTAHFLANLLEPPLQ